MLSCSETVEKMIFLVSITHFVDFCEKWPLIMKHAHNFHKMPYCAIAREAEKWDQNPYHGSNHYQKFDDSFHC